MSAPSSAPAASESFLARNEFLIRRLFSLCGLVPIGAYMVVHLLVNATMVDSPAAFQSKVYQIHSFGKALLVIEWLFIFLPIIFHAIIGVVIVRGGLPNSGTYTFESNVRYTLQRATGLIAFAFIFLHVFHMHGWLHLDWWINNVAQPLGGAKFKPYNAASSAAAALQGSPAWILIYLIGVLSCVFHLSNGIWSFGVRWGLWISPAAMKRALVACTVFGVGLAGVGTMSLWGPLVTNISEAKKVEDSMYGPAAAAGIVPPNEHKRSKPTEKTK